MGVAVAVAWSINSLRDERWELEDPSCSPQVTLL